MSRPFFAAMRSTSVFAFAMTSFAHDGDHLIPVVNEPLPITEKVIMGEGAFVFETVPGWGELADHAPIGPTHGGVALDRAGLIYVSTDTPDGIRVYSADGKLVRNMASDFAGTHSLMVREENGEEFLYGAHLRGARAFKMKLDGTPVLTMPFPPEAGAYGPKGEGYKPTSVAVAPDGAIFVADGYGTSLIHKYDAAGKYLKTFGGKGKEDGKFQACHGIAIDVRSGTPLLLVCDRENRRLQHFDLDGNFVAVIARDLRRPCAISFLGDNAVIAELEGRVTILDKANREVAHLGDNPEVSERANFNVPPASWHAGVFTAPHGVSWDKDGSIYVQCWNKTGRVTKLARVR